MSRRVSHCAIARSTSTSTPTSIQGLIAYSTLKNVGRVMAYRRRREQRVVALLAATSAKLSWSDRIAPIERNQSLFIAFSRHIYCMQSAIAVIYCVEGGSDGPTR